MWLHTSSLTCTDHTSISHSRRALMVALSSSSAAVMRSSRGRRFAHYSVGWEALEASRVEDVADDGRSRGIYDGKDEMLTRIAC